MHQNQPTIIIRQSGFSRRAAVLCACVFLLAAAAPVFAHGGFDHVIGTVAKVDHNTLTVTTAKGPVLVMLNDKTEITKDSKKAVQTDLKPGARVVVDIPEGSKDKIAHSVKIGVMAAADHDDDHDYPAHK
jgi:hypothetical protein